MAKEKYCNDVSQEIPVEFLDPDAIAGPITIVTAQSDTGCDSHVKHIAPQSGATMSTGSDICGGHGGQAQPLRLERTGNHTPIDAPVWVLDRVAREIHRSIRVHGALTPDLLRSTALLCEEAGEALQAALDATRMDMYRTDATHLGDLLHLEVEAVQTASSAIQLLTELDRQIKHIQEADARARTSSTEKSTT